MSNWHQSKVYCNGCGRWMSPIAHNNCPRGRRGSVTWLDLENFNMGCDKCNQVWPLESNVFTCSCGHIQYTEYVDTEVALEYGDEVIAVDGDIVYVLRETGELVVAEREYVDFDVA